MKLVFAIAAVIILLASFIADYKWRQWMAARRAQREDPRPGDPHNRRDFE